MTYFSHTLSHYPELDKEIINEAFVGEYYREYDVWHCDSQLFQHTDFFRVLSEKLGGRLNPVQNPRFSKLLPYQLKDWHKDSTRDSGINWMIKPTQDSRLFYRTQDHERRWFLEETVYNLYRPTLIRGNEFHSVFNNSNEERIILTLSLPIAYDEAKQLLCSWSGVRESNPH